jgi:predicted Fe-Mo cluster-binding NifX family protein
MRLAIPTRNERISPVLDSARLILLVDVDEGMERSRCIAPLPADSLAGRVSRLKELGVAVLICGGISRTLKQMIEASGIRVYPWTVGPVDDVLDAYREGRLHETRWQMPGCGNRTRRGPARCRDAASGRRGGAASGGKGERGAGR